MLDKFSYYVFSWWNLNQLHLKEYFLDLVGYKDKVYILFLKYLFFYFFFKLLFDMLFFFLKKMVFYYFFFLNELYGIMMSFFKSYEFFFVSYKFFYFFYSFVYKFVNIVFMVFSLGKMQDGDFYVFIMNLSMQKVYFFFFDKLMLFIVWVLDFLFFNSRFLYLISIISSIMSIMFMLIGSLISFSALFLLMGLMYVYMVLKFLSLWLKYNMKTLSCVCFFYNHMEKNSTMPPIFLSEDEKSLGFFRFLSLLMSQRLIKIKYIILGKVFWSSKLFFFYKFFYYIFYLSIIFFSSMFFFIMFVFDYVYNSLHDSNNY